MDTSAYQVSDADDTEVYWQIDQLEVKIVFGSGIDISFSPTPFNNSEMGGSAENHILPDDEEDKQNSPPTTSVTGRLTQPPALPRSRPLRTKLEISPDCVF